MSMPRQLRLLLVDDRPLPVTLPVVCPGAAIGYGDLVLRPATVPERREGPFAEDGTFVWRLAPQAPTSAADVVVEWRDGYDELDGRTLSLPSSWQRRRWTALGHLVARWEGDRLLVRPVARDGAAARTSIAAHTWVFVAEAGALAPPHTEQDR